MYQFLTTPVGHQPEIPDEEDKAQHYCSGALGDEEPQSETDDMVSEYPRNGDIPTEGHNMPEEAALPEEPYVLAPREEPVPDEALSAEEVSIDLPLDEEPTALDTVPETSQAELIIERFGDVEENPLNQRDRPHEPVPEPDISLMDSRPAEDDECLIPPRRAAHNAEHKNLKFHPSPPSVPSSRMTSIFEDAAPGAPPEDSHSITLKILYGSKVLRSVVFVRACTRTAILNEAKEYCAKCARDDQSLGTLLGNGCDLALLSLKMYGCDMDLSTYQVENLSSLVRTVEKTGIPRFTLRIAEA